MCFLTHRGVMHSSFSDKPATPNLPWALLPHANKRPDDVTAMVWSCPAVMSTTLSFASRGSYEGRQVKEGSTSEANTHVNKA